MWTEVKNQTKNVFSDGNTSERAVPMHTWVLATYEQRNESTAIPRPSYTEDPQARGSGIIPGFSWNMLNVCFHGGKEKHLIRHVSGGQTQAGQRSGRQRDIPLATVMEPLQLQYSLVSYWVSMQFCGSVWSHHPKGRRGG
ncbi:uncharacterized protein sb:cb288 isoform X1 [Oncorhynchus mykiss]|uniref:uncharacterized protein sb:cb288 isoform X1 n=2 Tax=Oncorhynchus TaxID=8016 RepID=UPI000B4ED688|nr:uncharacterized protein sb:cb288 isoform X1 [Oncorhynchus mykiss]